jgi:hypothetical protein
MELRVVQRQRGEPATASAKSTSSRPQSWREWVGVESSKQGHGLVEGLRMISAGVALLPDALARNEGAEEEAPKGSGGR